jgi:hypothetical protein
MGVGASLDCLYPVTSELEVANQQGPRLFMIVHYQYAYRNVPDGLKGCEEKLTPRSSAEKKRDWPPGCC